MLRASLVIVLVSGVVEVELLRAGQVHHNIEQQELTGSQGADHHASRGKAHGAQLDESDLRGDSAQSLHNGSGAASASLVHLQYKKQR